MLKPTTTIFVEIKFTVGSSIMKTNHLVVHLEAEVPLIITNLCHGKHASLTCTVNVRKLDASKTELVQNPDAILPIL